MPARRRGAEAARVKVPSRAATSFGLSAGERRAVEATNGESAARARWKGLRAAGTGPRPKCRHGRGVLRCPTSLARCGHLLFSSLLSATYRHTRPMVPTSEYDVVIVGAGPAGLMLATWLSALKIRTKVVDKRSVKVLAGQADGVQVRFFE